MQITDKSVLFVDFETFYDTKAKYGLKELSIVEYIRADRFKVHGLAYRWMHDERTHWISDDHVINAWVRSIDWSQTVVVAHNVRFDGSILAWRYGVKPALWFDTVGLAKAVLGENVSGYHLKGLADFLGLPAKGELKWDGVRTLTLQQEEEMAEYCKNDTDICKGIYEKLAPQFPQSQLKAMDWTIRAFVEPRLVLGEEVLSEGVQAEKARREKVIAESGVSRDVLSSNKQFADLLESRGIAVPTKISGRTGKPIPAFARTDDGLAALQRTHPCLYAGRIASKANLLETRGESLLAVSRTGPFPFDVGFSGAVQTHRYSGGSGAGGNPQNFTRKSFLREAVGPPPGHSLVVGDFAAVELWLLAQLAREPKLVVPLINGVRIYSEFASMHYQRPINKHDNPTEDAFGKSSILGLGYNMGWERFIDKVRVDTGEVISEETSKATVNLYRTTYFNVPKLWETCHNLIPLIAEGRISSLFFAPFIKVRKNALILPSGLAIQYPNLRAIRTLKYGRPHTEWVYDYYEKRYEVSQTHLYGGKIVENICQALAGELCKEAITRAEQNGLECVGQVHDEILAITRDPEQGKKILQAAMETAPSWWPALKIKAEVKYGKNWNKAK